MTRPNFFIIGAPKAGTTSLAKYLESHPNCYLSSNKEPHYFSTDVEVPISVRSRKAYFKLFQGAGKEHLAVGEGSVHYLQSRDACKNIYSYDKNARLIAMLRNPVDLVYSYHLYRVQMDLEWDIDMETAWNLQDPRARGENIPKIRQTPNTYHYKDVASLGDQVERLLACFPRKQIKFIFNEDFAAQPKRIYEKVLDFLEVPQNGKQDFHRFNAYRNFKSVRLHQALNSLSPFTASVARSVKKTLGLDRIGIMPKIRNWNLVSTQKRPLAPEFRAMLVEEFRADVEKLSQILNRDLSHWNR